MPARPRSADDPPKRTPSFVCEVPLRVSPAQERMLLARLEAARQVYNACLGQARRGCGWCASPKPSSTPGRCPATIPRAEGALCPGPHPARLLGVRAARLRPAVRPLLAGAAPGQPHHPDARHSGLPRRQPAAPGQRPPGAVQGQTPARYGGRQDQHQWHPLVRGPGGVEGAGAAGAPRSARSGAGPRTRLPGQVRAAGAAQAGRAQPLLRPAGVPGDALRKPQHQLGTGIVGLDLGPSTIAVVAEQAGAAPAVLSRGGPRCEGAAPTGPPVDRRAQGPTTRPTTTERGRAQTGSEALEGVQARAEGAGPAARAAPEAGGHPQAQSWQPAIGRRRWAAPSSGATPPSGVAEDRRESVHTPRAGYVRRVVVCLAASAWRDRRAHERLACTTLPNVRRGEPEKARSERWQAARTGPPQRGSLPPYRPASWESRTSRRRGSAPKRRGRGGSPPVPPAYEQAICNQPPRGRRLPAAFGRPPAHSSQSGSAAEGSPVGPESAEV